jgi:chromosome segregation ATPase
VKRRLGESEKEEEARKRRIEQLTEELTRVGESLREVEVKEAEYQRKIDELNREKSALSRDVDGLLEEVERQEAGLQVQTKMKADLEMNILRLSEELSRVKGRLPKPKQKKKALNSAEKRFRVLYKNLSFTDRAVDGFLSLTEEYQLKAEEMIHRLNENASLVTVKRKVFGKGGKMDILETDFAYSGRLYFQKDSQSTKIRVVAIGTKNTQDKDLAYLESVK